VRRGAAEYSACWRGNAIGSMSMLDRVPRIIKIETFSTVIKNKNGKLFNA